MIICLSTLENMSLNIKIVVILQLKLKLLRISIFLINGAHLGFSEGYVTSDQMYHERFELGVPLNLCMQIVMLSSQK